MTARVAFNLFLPNAALIDSDVRKEKTAKRGSEESRTANCSNSTVPQAGAASPWVGVGGGISPAVARQPPRAVSQYGCVRWPSLRRVCPGLRSPLRKAPWAGGDLFTQYIVNIGGVQAECGWSLFRVPKLWNNLKHYWLRSKILVDAFLICVCSTTVSE